MKKLLALILCLSMILGAVAFATETELNKDVMEGQTTVSLTIDPEANEFVVVIPASATIDPTTRVGSFDVVLKAGWKLPSSNGLTVKIKEFANGPTSFSDTAITRDVFKLKNNDGKTAKYSVYPKADGASDYGEALHNYGGGTGGSSWRSIKLIDVKKTDSNENDRIASLKLKVTSLPTDPGEYTDTITFAIELY